MTTFEIIVLAIVQGIAEFLPISSSGHLVILAAIFNQDAETFDVADLTIVLHAGTLLSILVFYWNRILMLLREDRRTIPLIIIGTIPAAIAGVVIKKMFKEILSNPMLAGAMLIVTGLILLFASRQKQREGTYQELTLGKAFGIGVAQAFAILPGISRSGSTIAAGISAGLSRRDSATFSFLLAIPAIGGAAFLEIIDILRAESVTQSTSPKLLALGALISFVVGLFSLWLLLRTLEKGKLEWFSYWCIPVGIAVLAWQL